MADLFAPRSTPRVFTIPPSTPFLPALATTLWDELGAGDFDLTDTVILLPTRRAARALGDAFLQASGKTALLLPTIRTLGDLDPDEAALGDLADGLSLPPAIDPLQRRLELAWLVQARGKASGGDWSEDPVAALNAADALCDLLDAAALAGDCVDWARLPDLVNEGDLAQHWQQSVAFLDIITKLWPTRLAELDRVDPGTRQRLALINIAERWLRQPPAGPVILAGSTGTVPATRTLMAAIARLPRGAVVLPGLDRHLPDTAWETAAKDDQHAQRSMALALEACGIERGDVAVWPGVVETGPARLRLTVLNEALTPADATDDWRRRVDEIGACNVAAGLMGLALADAATEEEEASAIALTLRKTLETPNATAALVTPDPDLAARVAAKLLRWDIRVDVSAGRPLAATTAGSFLMLLLEWALDPVEPVALCALLKHPLTSLGMERPVLSAHAGALEAKILRQTRDFASLTDLESLVWQENKRISWEPSQRKVVSDLIVRLAAATLPLCQLFTGPVTLPNLSAALTDSAEALAKDRDGGSSLWADEAGNAAATLLADMISYGDAFDAISPRAALRMVEALMQGRVVRPRGTHPRLALLGPLEARLLHFDQIVIGGLDEGTWPATPGHDPFLSRPMRNALGLPSPEQRIGLQAHDFVQLAASAHVMMTRAARRGDSPTVPSRWLWRLQTLAKGAMGKDAADDAFHAQPLNWARALAPHQRTFDAIKAKPEPRPPVEARPEQFSATEIETWIRDPFAIYARKILKLSSLGPLGGDVGVAERGTAVHQALESLGLGSLEPHDISERLNASLREYLFAAGYRGAGLEATLVRLRPAVRAFVAWEVERRPLLSRTLIEQKGVAKLALPSGDLTITAQADRIDLIKDGTVAVIDYKTGRPPGKKEVAAQMNPQLPVTGLIVEQGGFGGDIDKNRVSELTYFRFGSKDAGASAALGVDGDVQAAIADAAQGIVALAAQYADPTQPYLSKPRPKFSSDYGDYDHLARRAEWAAIDETEEVDGEAVS